MQTLIRECRPDEFAEVVRHLDSEFIWTKGRSLSLGERFPNTISAKNLTQIRVAVCGGVLQGALAIKFFDWVLGDATGRAAMVGMVWVDSQFRRRRVGSQLMLSSIEFLSQAAIDFAVLWTGSPWFYQRSGWFSSDRGLFGEAVIRPAKAPLHCTCEPLKSVEPQWLEHRRTVHLPNRVVRSVVDYQTIPIPALNVLCFRTRSLDGAEGFAIVGEGNGTGYVYEMVSAPNLWPVIWADIAQKFGRLFVNGWVDEPFSHWLGENGFVRWSTQNKAMWYQISGRTEDFVPTRLNVSYFDWI